MERKKVAQSKSKAVSKNETFDDFVLEKFKNIEIHDDI
jgi:hypothetical protein